MFRVLPNTITKDMYAFPSNFLFVCGAIYLKCHSNICLIHFCFRISCYQFPISSAVLQFTVNAMVTMYGPDIVHGLADICGVTFLVNNIL